MRKPILVPLAATLIMATSAVAQQKMDGMKDMDMKQMNTSKTSDIARRRTHESAGVVKKIDLKAGTVNLDEEPVPSLKWPAMNMTFKVRNPELLKDVAAGQRVQFTFIQKGSDYVITQLGK